MIIIDAQQGSYEWLKSRLGIPTASQFHRLVTPKKLEPSAQIKDYAAQLLAEWITGEPLDDADARSQFMERGSDLEAEAIANYEFDTMTEARRVGFVKRDDGRAGCSPDLLIGDDGGADIKCRSAHKHVAALLDPESERTATHLQLQGCMWICERQWWDVYGYNPAFPRSQIRVERDDRIIGAIDGAVNALHEVLEAGRIALLALGAKPRLLMPDDASCKARREDGRWCMSRAGVVQVDGEWRCAAHVAEMANA